MSKKFKISSPSLWGDKKQSLYRTEVLCILVLRCACAQRARCHVVNHEREGCGLAWAIRKLRVNVLFYCIYLWVLFRPGVNVENKICIMNLPFMKEEEIFKMWFSSCPLEWNKTWQLHIISCYSDNYSLPTACLSTLEMIERMLFFCTNGTQLSVGFRKASLWFEVRKVVLQNELKSNVSESCMMDTLHSCWMALSKIET